MNDRDPAVDEHVAVYLRFREVFGDPTKRSYMARKRDRKQPGTSVPFAPGRDPHGLSAVMDRLTDNMGWNSPLARSELLLGWPLIVGAETAEHSKPVGIEELSLIHI